MALSFATDATLNNGLKMPLLGLGTFLSQPNEVAQAVEAALKAGYRHIDGAWVYKNQEEVAKGWKASGVAVRRCE